MRGDHIDRSSREGWEAGGKAGPGQDEGSAAPPIAEESQMVRCEFCHSFKADLP